MVEDGQPERVEAQVDEDHDEEERDTGAPQRDALAIEEPAIDVACEKAGAEKAREEDTRAKQCRADEVGGRGNETSLHGPVHCTIDGNRQEPERDTHEDRLDGKDIGEEDSQGHGDTGINERLDGESGHEKRPSFPLWYTYRRVPMCRSVAATRNVFERLPCLQQRDAMLTPQPDGFRPAINSPYTQHLTRMHLLCLFFCIDVCSIAQIFLLGNSRQIGVRGINIKNAARLQAVIMTNYS